MAAGSTTPVPGRGYPDEWEADVLLRDGHPVHLRPISPADGEALRAFHASLSDRTVYYRFFSVKPTLSDEDVVYFTTVDHHDRVALIALDAGSIIGVGRYDAIGDGTAEVAFVIRDETQGLGLGSVLLEHLAAAALERGVQRFVAEVLPDNRRMIATFREAGYDVTQRREEDVLAVSFDIEPTTASRAVMAAREQRAEARSVQRLLQPHGVAVIGASRRPGGLGHAILRHVADGGYTGRLVAVHPEVDEIAGVACVRSLAEVAGEIDLAVVVVPADRVADVIRDAAAAEVHGLVVVSGGFGDVGGEGPRLQEELVGLVHGTGMRLVGPNALGVINTAPDVRLNASLVPQFPSAGHVGLFCQSGALGGSILGRLAARGLGVSTFVSAGNRADISGNDLLQFWEEDERTSLIALYLETIGNARKFSRIVHRLSASKPVVMVRTGGAGQRHPLGHDVGTTLLTQKAVDQILGDCGLIVVDSIDQMIGVARVAVSQPHPPGPGVAVIGNSDALGVLATNALHGTGLAAARPVVTFARQAPEAAYAEALADAVADHAVGVVLVIHVPAIEEASQLDLAAIIGSLPEAGDDAPHRPAVVAVMPGGVGGGRPGEVPVFEDVEDALHAVTAYVRYAEWVRADARRRSAPSSRPEPSDERLAPGTLAAEEALALLPPGLATLAAGDGGAPSVGARITLVDDPLFGPVIEVGVDDAVAQALDDRSSRLAPVGLDGARGMLEDLGALPVLALDEEGIEAMSTILATVSALPASTPGVTSADLRGVAPVLGRDLTLRGISVTVSLEPADPDPTTRRL